MLSIINPNRATNEERERERALFMIKLKYARFMTVSKKFNEKG